MGSALVAVRVLVGAFFAVTGCATLVNHAAVTALFAHWQVAAPGGFAVAVGALELVCGLLLTFAVLTRPVALLLATLMVGATMTAGRVDGGMYLVVPPILFFLCVVLAWRTGRFAPAPLKRPGVQ